MDASNCIYCEKCRADAPAVLFESKVYCTVCHSTLCNWVQALLPFGKYKGHLVHLMNSAQDLRYLTWFVNNITDLSETLYVAILIQIGLIARVYRSPVPQAWWAELLDLPAHFSKSEIKSSYRLLSKRLHPDMGGSTEEMQRLNEARSIADNLATY